MENIMSEGILLTVNLKPRVGKFNDTKHVRCTRKTKIDGHAIKSWIHGICPSWEKPFIWKNMKPGQRMSSYLKRCDEGYGYSFVEL